MTRLLPFLSFLAAAVSAQGGGTTVSVGDTPPPVGTPPPNVVLIVADDQGYHDLGSYGHPTIETPRIDRLAAEGLRLTDFYAGASLCTPARAAFLTGSYPKRVRMHQGVVWPNSNHGLDPAFTTIADALKARGYATGMFGKWHLGHRPGFLPTNHGFDEWLGIPYSNDMNSSGGGTSVEELDEGWANHATSWERFNVPLMHSLADGETVTLEQPVNQTLLTDRLTDAAIDFIERRQRQPFFVYLPHPMPHVPLYVSEERYAADPLGAYERVVEHLDAATGRLLDTLEDLGLEDNTIVIYTSDNGPWLPKDHHGGSADPLRGGKL
ncbi:MAG: sulfatase-like hydrolase/transferase [Puniceicoccaceae bacterium]